MSPASSPAEVLRHALAERKPTIEHLTETLILFRKAVAERRWRERLATGQDFQHFQFETAFHSVLMLLYDLWMGRVGTGRDDELELTILDARSPRRAATLGAQAPHPHDATPSNLVALSVNPTKETHAMRSNDKRPKVAVEHNAATASPQLHALMHENEDWLGRITTLRLPADNVPLNARTPRKRKARDSETEPARTGKDQTAARARRKR